MVSTSRHQPEPGLASSAPLRALSGPVLSHLWGLRPACSLAAGRIGSGRAAAHQVRMVWAGVSLAFHTSPLRGRGVPEIIRAGCWLKKKKKKQTQPENK